MRVLFLGSPEFAVPSLKALIEDSRFEVIGVITQPDRKAGRGQKVTPPPVKQVALDSQIPVFQFPRIRNSPEAAETLEQLDPGIMVVVAFGQILPPEFFEFPAYGTLNVHASILPKYRGAAPVTHAILNGETETGVSIMRIDEGMDTGDVLTQKTVQVSKTVTTGELEARLSLEGASLLMETIGGYVSGEIKQKPQIQDQVSYAPRITKEDARICWKEDSLRVHNRVRAMNPWPGAFTQFREQELKIWRTDLVEEPLEIDPGAPAGTIAAVSKSQVVVSCAGPSFLSLITLQLPNRKRVTAGDFVNGTQLKVGERLT
jgi:methionyl-tRNA formyltransferase